jgi:hypothetical protein
MVRTAGLRSLPVVTSVVPCGMCMRASAQIVGVGGFPTRGVVMWDRARQRLAARLERSRAPAQDPQHQCRGRWPLEATALVAVREANME